MSGGERRQIEKARRLELRHPGNNRVLQRAKDKSNALRGLDHRHSSFSSGTCSGHYRTDHCGRQNFPKTGRPAQLVAVGILGYLDSWLAIFRSWGIHARPPCSRAPITSSNNRYVSCWHETDLRPCPQFGRYRGESGHSAEGPFR